MARDQLIEQLDRTRLAHGFRTIEQTMALTDRDNVIFDPFSTLVAVEADIGARNVFYPHTCLRALPGLLSIGDGNVFHSGTTLQAREGQIRIGDTNIFGAGTVTVSTCRDRSAVTIGSDGRFRGCVEIDGQCMLGDGCQIPGHISVLDVTLAGGGSFRHPIADERGAVLKGQGSARDITLEKGQVIAGDGTFSLAGRKMQSFYHPEAT